jgi:hypothetical protein
VAPEHLVRSGRVQLLDAPRVSNQCTPGSRKENGHENCVRVIRLPAKHNGMCNESGHSLTGC